MSKLTDEQIEDLYFDEFSINKLKEFARAIEAAATEPLLQRIAELEKALKLVQQHHATAWNRGHIAGMAANRMVAQDALNAVKKDAWNNTQLTEALMAAEARCEELKHQLEEALKDAERYRFIRDANRSSCIDGEIAMYAMESLDEYVDAAMEDEAKIVGDAAMQKGQS